VQLKGDNFMLKPMMTAALVAGLLCLSPAQTQKSEAVSQSIEELEALNYPYLARLSGFTGRVVVMVKLDDTGRVVSASIVPKLGRTERLLTDDTLANAHKWRFHPNPQKEALLVYDFSIEKGCTELQIESAVPSNFHFKAPNLATVTACPLPK
jgi:TonB family protein